MKKKVLKILKFLQDYSFPISFACSIFISVLFLFIFHVLPWDKYTEIEMKKNREDFHYKVSYYLLEKGFYKESLLEFNKVLELNQNNYNALNGKYFCNLFLELEEDEWDPNYSMLIINNIKTSGDYEKKNWNHILEKYLGDFNNRLNNISNAVNHYKKALELNNNYVDALYTYGWFNYFNFHYNNYNLMEKYFNRLIKVDSLNYKGYHGKAYAFYMRAIDSEDTSEIRLLLDSATNLCETAKKLRFFYICPIMDFGEICRTTNPVLSKDFHLFALDIINDEKRRKICNNNKIFGINLINSYFISITNDTSSTIYLESIEQKSSFIKYQLALDYYAMFKNNLIKRNEYEKNFYLYFNDAKKMDKYGSIEYIFIDQKKIFHKFLKFLKD